MELKCVNSVTKPIEKSATTEGKRKNDPKTRARARVCVCVRVCFFFCCSHRSPLEDLSVGFGCSYITAMLPVPTIGIFIGGVVPLNSGRYVSPYSRTVAP